MTYLHIYTHTYIHTPILTYIHTCGNIYDLDAYLNSWVCTYVDMISGRYMYMYLWLTQVWGKVGW